MAWLPVKATHVRGLVVTFHAVTNWLRCPKHIFEANSLIRISQCIYEADTYAVECPRYSTAWPKSSWPRVPVASITGGSCDCRMTSHYYCSSMVCKCTGYSRTNMPAMSINMLLKENYQNVPKRNGSIHHIMKVDPVNCPSIGQFYLSSTRPKMHWAYTIISN